MKRHTIELCDQDLAILNEALIQLPFRIVAPVIEKIKQQLQQQQHEHDNPGDGPSAFVNTPVD